MLHDVNISSFDLNHVRALHHLLEEAHVGRAAARLGITPAAASNALRRLRTELGDPLLVRDGRSLVRTALGTELRDPAREVVAAAARLLERAAPFDALRFDGDIEVSIADHVAAVVLPRLEKLLRRRAPRASLRVRPIPLGFEAWLRESGAVLVAPSTLISPRQSGDGLESERYYEDSFACLLRSRHPMLSGPWTAARFAKARHLLVAPRGATDRGAVDEALAARGLARDIACVVPSFALAVSLARQGDYVVTLPEAYARITDMAGMTLRTPPVDVPHVAMRLVWHGAHAHDGRLRFVRSLLQEALPNTHAAEVPRTQGAR